MDDPGATDRVDDALRDVFAGMSQPILSPYFGRDLRHRVAEEGARLRSLRRRRLVMRVYWLLAAACSLVVLQRTVWPNAGTAGGILAISFFAGSFLPVLLVLRSLRTDVIDLVLGTCDRFWGLGPRV